MGMSKGERDCRRSVLLAVEILPACADHASRRALLDETHRSLLFMAQQVEERGYLERAATYRRVVRALAGLSPMAVDIPRAGALYAALLGSEHPGADRHADRVLSGAGL